MKIAMTSEVQSIILSVQLYKRFLIADAYARRVFPVIDKKTENKIHDYFVSLPLPDGMTKNAACQRAVENYPINITMDYQEHELPLLFSLEW